MRRILILSVIALCVFIIWGFSWKEDRWSGSTMGTTYTVHIFKPGLFQSGYSRVPSVEELKKFIEDDLLSINQSMSTYIKDSELSLLNELPASEICRPVSSELYEVLEIAKQVHTNTNGYYDVTVGPLVDLWGFGGKSQLKLNWQPPTQKEIETVLNQVGFDHIKLDPARNCVVKMRHVEIDLSSVAKGYGVDFIAKSLQSNGVDNFLVEIGGEIYTSGQKQPLRPWLSQSPWQVLIESPVRSNDDTSVKATSNELSEVLNTPLTLTNMAIATSGNYRNYFEHKGQVYSHILNPQDGQPFDQSTNQYLLSSVSILDRSTAAADAYATGLFALGLKDAKALAVRHQLAVVLVYTDRAATEFDVWLSPAFQMMNAHEF